MALFAIQCLLALLIGYAVSPARWAPALRVTEPEPGAEDPSRDPDWCWTHQRPEPQGDDD